MIRVTIELISAINGRTSTLGTMFIANDATGDVHHGNYVAAACRKGTTDVPRELYGSLDGWSPGAIDRHPKAARAGTIKQYPRRAYNVWRLITRACLAVFPEELPSKKLPKGTAPMLDAEVMRGLHAMSCAADGAYDHGTVDDVTAAREWLDASRGYASVKEP